MPFKQIREKKPPTDSKAVNGESSAGAGQTTLDGRTLLVNGTNGSHGGIVDEVNHEVGDPNAQLEQETKRATAGGNLNEFPGSRDIEMR